MYIYIYVYHTHLYIYIYIYIYIYRYTNKYIAHARRQKEERTYRDIVTSGRCRFITCGLEVGGRWAPAFLTFVSRLAMAKARSAPKLLQTAARHWWKQRWQSMLAVAAQTAFAESLTADVMGAPPCIDGEAPQLAELAV